MHQPTANVCVLLHLILSIFGSGLAGNVPTAAAPTPNVTNTSSTELDTKTFKSDSQNDLASRLDELRRFFQAANETNLLESIFVRLEKLQAALYADGWKKDCRKDSELRHDTKLAGSTYIRWGRTTCEGDARVVYRGYAANAHWQHQGGGSNYICLHERPQWGKYVSEAATWSGTIYGVEYEFFNDMLSNRHNDGHPVLNKPAPCVACSAPNRISSLMIPARKECPHGWTKEYSGYLGAHASHINKTSYTCWDEAPEIAIGGTNQNQAVVHPIEVGCGTLPCSIYKNGYELTCVVCTQ